MSSHRPYRPALGVDAALDEIRAGCGRLYDAQVVEACLELITGGSFRFEDQPGAVRPPESAAGGAK